MPDVTDTPKIPPSSASLVAQADADVGHIDVASATDMLKVTDARFIDVRDVRELSRTGRIPGAKHCPRGMLEFWIDQESPYHRPLFAEDATFVFYCASGWRSALAAQTAKQMGLQKVTHLKGGITAWIEAGKPTEARETS